MTEVAKARGIEGTVINGADLDLQESRAIDYPIRSKHGHMRTGKVRVALQAANVPVAPDLVQVEPGDEIRADGAGVVVVPLARAMEVLRAGKAIETTQSEILIAVRKGVALGEARMRQGYQALQTRQEIK